MERDGARGAPAKKVLNSKDDELCEIEKSSLKEPRAADRMRSDEMIQNFLNDVNEQLAIYDSEEVINSNERIILPGLEFSNEM